MTVYGLMMAFTTGVALAAVYLWLLWRALQQLAGRRDKGWFMLGGMLLRIGLVVTGLFFIMHLGTWLHVGAALVGFALARWAITRRVSMRHDDAPVVKRH